MLSKRPPLNIPQLQVEHLESRRLLAITAVFEHGVLNIESDGQDQDQIIVTSEQGLVKINGFDPYSGQLQAEQVNKISARGNLHTDLIDLSLADPLEFTSLSECYIDFIWHETQFPPQTGMQRMVLGSPVADEIWGSNDPEIIHGGDGNDTIYGMAGDDVLIGGAGNDELYGLGGDDTLYGENGDDSLFGGYGNDVMIGGDGNDYLYNTLGNNTLDGGAGDDVLIAGNGNDWLHGGTGSDTLTGGGGNDTYAFLPISSLLGTKVINESSQDRNTLDFQYITNDISIKLGTAGPDISDTQEVITGVLHIRLTSNSGITDVIGGTGNDYILGNSRDNLLDGRNGNDTIIGAVGNDTILGGEGDDLLAGITGHNHIFGGLGNDNLIGGVGSDHLDGGQGNNSLAGGLGSDTYYFRWQPKQIFGLGHNIITETLNYGNDTLNFDDFHGTYPAPSLSTTETQAVSDGILSIEFTTANSIENAIAPPAEFAVQPLAIDDATNSDSVRFRVSNALQIAENEASIRYYIDSNHNGILDAGDTALGTQTDNFSEWYAVELESVPVGSQTFFAVTVDSQDIESMPTSTSVIIGQTTMRAIPRSLNLSIPTQDDLKTLPYPLGQEGLFNGSFKLNQGDTILSTMYSWSSARAAPGGPNDEDEDSDVIANTGFAHGTRAETHKNGEWGTSEDPKYSEASHSTEILATASITSHDQPGIGISGLIHGRSTSDVNTDAHLVRSIGIGESQTTIASAGTTSTPAPALIYKPNEWTLTPNTPYAPQPLSVTIGINLQFLSAITQQSGPDYSPENENEVISSFEISISTNSNEILSVEIENGVVKEYEILGIDFLNGNELELQSDMTGLSANAVIQMSMNDSLTVDYKAVQKNRTNADAHYTPTPEFERNFAATLYALSIYVMGWTPDVPY